MQWFTITLLLVVVTTFYYQQGRRRRVACILTAIAIGALLDVPRRAAGTKPPVTNAVTRVPPCQGVILEPRRG